MAINQSDIIKGLEESYKKLSNYPDKTEYFYDFLHAYGLPKSTITLLKKGDKSRSVGLDGDVALARKIYFKVARDDEDLDTALKELAESNVVAKNKIRFSVVTNFNELVAYDADAKEFLTTDIEVLEKQYAFFLPLAGYEKALMFSEHPADIKASENMGRLFDLIKYNNDLTKPEDIHALNVFLTRLLFCFYAEDTGLFQDGAFTKAIDSYTRKDGADIDVFLSALFTVLNTPENSPVRDRYPAHLTNFPYVNGHLFEADEPIPAFSKASRRILLACGQLDWSEINPDIFGSMFQAVIDTEQRGNLGQHYTSVPNIMKVLQPLFLDDLQDTLSKAIGNKKRLQAFLHRLTRIRIMDVACGSANFLIIAYKELRELEMQAIDALNELDPQMYFSGITLDQFYGIEIDDFASEIAVLSLWIAEHQMSNKFKDKFGHAPDPLPLGRAGNILCANSLRVDWREVMPKEDSRGVSYEVYLCGNPPFLGDGSRSPEQLKDMDTVLSSFKNKRKVDYIATFFWRGAQYIKDGGALAFVSTNSICQGVQVANLWPNIFDLGVEIAFAYQSFPWANNAKNQAGVHVVIVGLSSNARTKTIYKNVDGDIQKTVVKNISPYLTSGSNLAVQGSTVVLSSQSKMVRGSMPTDGGHLLMTHDEKELLITQESNAERWIRQYMGASEFIKGDLRYCLWLVGATECDINSMPLVKGRVNGVRNARLASKAPTTKEGLASTPHLFAQIAQPTTGNYIIVPIVSSERRTYVPIGFLDHSVIASNLVNIIPNASFYDFGVLTSILHNTWMAAVCGRLGSGYRYSATVVYNTFPWPETTKSQRDHIETLAQNVLLAREEYPNRSLAELYDPDKMPDSLRAAHKTLDLAVDRLYREAPFRDNTERLEHLFMRYEKLITAENAGKAITTKPMSD